MGHAACVIIINCGALKSKATELSKYPFEILKPIAAEMETFEGELCDNASLLAEQLDTSDAALVVKEGERGWQFASEMQAFMNSRIRELPSPRREGVDQNLPQVLALFEAMRAFLDAQMKFFHDLVAKYAIPGTGT